MEYKELQQQAKELGLPYNGVSKEDLIKSIEEAQGNSIPEGTKESKVEKKGKKQEAEYNTAIVFEGANEVRRYELVAHGENFEELANEFVSNKKEKGYMVKLAKVDAGIVCPRCGHEFRPKKVLA